MKRVFRSPSGAALSRSSTGVLVRREKRLIDRLASNLAFRAPADDEAQTLLTANLRNLVPPVDAASCLERTRAVLANELCHRKRSGGGDDSI